jgi:hypothetical protein
MAAIGGIVVRVTGNLAKQLMGMAGIGGIVVRVTGNPASNSWAWSASAASWE